MNARFTQSMRLSLANLLVGVSCLGGCSSEHTTPEPLPADVGEFQPPASPVKRYTSVDEVPLTRRAEKRLLTRLDRIVRRTYPAEALQPLSVFLDENSYQLKWKLFHTSKASQGRVAQALEARVQFHGTTNDKHIGEFNLSSQWHPPDRGWGVSVQYQTGLRHDRRFEVCAVAFAEFDAGSKTRRPLPSIGYWRMAKRIRKIDYTINIETQPGRRVNESHRQYFQRVFASAESFRDHYLDRLDALADKIDSDLPKLKGVEAVRMTREADG